MVTLLVEKDVESQARYGMWRVEERVGDSTRHVVARCLSCDSLYTVDIYELRRKDRKNERCRTCSNRITSKRNILPDKRALLNAQRHSYKKSAKKRNKEWLLTDEQFDSLVLGDCFYCGAEPNRLIETCNNSMLLNGIDRNDNSRGYDAENCVTACKDCNYAKRKMSQEDFFDMCRRVSEKWL